MKPLNQWKIRLVNNFKKENFKESDIIFKRYGSFRYLGQDHSVEISLKNGIYNSDDIENIVLDFHNQYEKEFTYRLDSQVDMIQFHLVAVAKIDKPALEKRNRSGLKVEDTIKEKRFVDFDEMGEHESAIYNFDKLEPGMEFMGPAIVEDSSTTVVIFPKQICLVDDYANLHVTIKENV